MKDIELIKEFELIKEWFDHIAQIANDRKTANGVVMTPEDALAEIKALAKDAAFYVSRCAEKHVKQSM